MQIEVISVIDKRQADFLMLFKSMDTFTNNTISWTYDAKALQTDVTAAGVASSSGLRNVHADKVDMEMGHHDITTKGKADHSRLRLQFSCDERVHRILSKHHLLEQAERLTYRIKPLAFHTSIHDRTLVTHNICDREDIDRNPTRCWTLRCVQPTNSRHCVPGNAKMIRNSDKYFSWLTVQRHSTHYQTFGEEEHFAALDSELETASKTSGCPFFFKLHRAAGLDEFPPAVPKDVACLPFQLSMTQVDEYDFDSSDEEDIRNTIGNIPVQWYDSFAHIGYDTSGRPIIRPNFADGKSDSIDEFLQRVDTGMGESNLEWRTVQDPQTGQFVVLSDHDLDMVTKMASHKGVLSAGDSGPYEPWNDWFTKDVLEMPVTAHPPQKRSFIPSLLDRRRVGRMVHAIKMGWFKPRLPAWALSDPNDPDALRRYAAYMTSGNLGALDSDEEEDNLGIPSAFVSSYVFPDVWADQDSGPGVKPDECEDSWRTRFPMLSQDYRPPRPRPYQKAPEEPLPGHIASYNPPPEFILSKDEQKKLMKAWRERLYDGHVSRVPPQMPQKFDCLRHVPFSERYLREREERVKDLVMATRVEKQRLATTPEAILPQIPSLSQLRPYPSQPGLTYGGHRGRVTSLSISPCGQWLASISPADGYLRIWETSTNYCFRCYSLASPIESRPPPATKKISGSQKKSQQQQESTSDGEQEEQQPCDSDEEWSCERPTAVVVWNPKPELHLLAAAICIRHILALLSGVVYVRGDSNMMTLNGQLTLIKGHFDGQSIFLINPALCDRVRVEQTNSGLEQWWTNRETEKSQKTAVEEASYCFTYIFCFTSATV
ncbi:ribosome biogenesis protein ERB1, partial [Clonorchis sinensis]